MLKQMTKRNAVKLMRKQYFSMRIAGQDIYVLFILFLNVRFRRMVDITGAVKRTQRFENT